MIKRFAFASLAVIGLAGPASAFDAQAAADGAVTRDEQVAGSDDAAPPRRFKRIAKPKIVAVLPPQRPDDAAAIEITAAPTSDVPASLAQAVPESRPTSALADAVQDAPVPSNTVGRTVTVLPPLRHTVAPAASALADVNQTEPLTAEIAPEPEMPSAKSSGKAVAVLPPSRPAFRGDGAPVETAALTTEPVPAAAAVPETGLFGSLFGSFPQTPTLDQAVSISSGRAGLDSLIATHAKLNGVPADLVHRVVIRESKYNPRAVGRGGALGLMQIKAGTARALGYEGSASGLLDAETNLTYAVKYLAGAYRTANGDYARAISYYARGYYYAQKRNGSIREASNRGRHRDRVRQEADATPPGVTWNTAAIASESSRVP